MGSKSSSSGVQFFPGQEKAIEGSNIFGGGGLFEQILAGRPDVASATAERRGLDMMDRRTATAGIDPASGIAQAGRSSFLSQTAAASEGDQLNRILGFMQPAGSTSRTSSAGAFTK